MKRQISRRASVRAAQRHQLAGIALLKQQIAGQRAVACGCARLACPAACAQGGQLVDMAGGNVVNALSGVMASTSSGRRWLRMRSAGEISDRVWLMRSARSMSTARVSRKCWTAHDQPPGPAWGSWHQAWAWLVAHTGGLRPLPAACWPQMDGRGQRRGLAHGAIAKIFGMPVNAQRHGRKYEGQGG